MEKVLKAGNQEHWWSLLLRGIFILIFATLAFVWPGITLAVLMIFFGVFVVVDGIFATVVSVRSRKDYKHWWLTLLGGVAGIVVGILVFMGTLIAGLVMLYLIAAWLIATGIVRAITAIWARKETAMGLPLTLGIASVCFGVAIFIMSLSMLLAMFWIIALFAMLIGVFLLIDAFQVRKRSRRSR